MRRRIKFGREALDSSLSRCSLQWGKTLICITSWIVYHRRDYFTFNYLVDKRQPISSINNRNVQFIYTTGCHGNKIFHFFTFLETHAVWSMYIARLFLSFVLRGKHRTNTLDDVTQKVSATGVT